MTIDEFVDGLVKIETGAFKDIYAKYKNGFGAFENMYANNVEGHENTVNNLKLYLKKMLKIKPKYLLVGEAPGYKGCRWSGIPFTSEEILVNKKKLVKINFFGLENGFKVRKEDKPEKENTAKIVWSYLGSKEIYPLMWNAFPFHPYKDKNKNSNRAPNKQELEFGRAILEELINIYSPEKVIAVGRKAEKSLKPFSKLFEDNNIEVKEVRHPSHGGKDDFIKGLDEYLK